MGVRLIKHTTQQKLPDGEYLLSLPWIAATPPTMLHNSLASKHSNNLTVKEDVMDLSW